MDLVFAETCFEQTVSKECQSVFDGRVVRLAEVSAQDDAFWADGANVSERRFPKDFAAVERGEAVLQIGANLCKPDLILCREGLGGEIGMGDDDVAHTLLTGRLNDGKDLVTTQVSCG